MSWERLLTNRTTADEIKGLDTEKYFQEIRVSELSKDGSCEKFGYKMAAITSFRTVNFGI